MSFNDSFLGQLVNKLPTLEEEIVQILTASEKPLSVSDIYNKSKVAVTSRDISLLLAKDRDQLNIEIAHYAARPGFRECAHYQMRTLNNEATDIQVPPVVDAPETKHEEVSEMNTEIKPKVLQILEYIEANARCTMQEIQTKLNDKMLGESYIKGYIKDHRVIVSKNSVNGKKEFRIALGKKVAEFYGVKVINKAPKVKVKDIQESVNAAPELPSTIDIDAVYKNIHTVSVDDNKRKFRVAITSDRTLLLFGIQSEPIELDIFESNTLIDFCDAVGLSIPITVPMLGTDSHTVAGKQL